MMVQLVAMVTPITKLIRIIFGFNNSCPANSMLNNPRWMIFILTPAEPMPKVDKFKIVQPILPMGSRLEMVATRTKRICKIRVWVCLAMSNRTQIRIIYQIPINLIMVIKKKMKLEQAGRKILWTLRAMKIHYRKRIIVWTSRCNNTRIRMMCNLCFII